MALILCNMIQAADVWQSTNATCFGDHPKHGNTQHLLQRSSSLFDHWQMGVVVGVCVEDKGKESGDGDLNHTSLPCDPRWKKDTSVSARKLEAGAHHFAQI
jgi:hypothetical protein